MDLAQEVEADCPCTAVVVVVIDCYGVDCQYTYFKSVAMEFAYVEIQYEFDSADDDDSNNSTA